MKFSRFMTIYALVSALFGLGFVIAPGPLLSLAALSGLIRDAADSPARCTIVSSLLVGEALDFLLVLIGQLRGIFNALGWPICNLASPTPETQHRIE